jgi:hypothetical protein
LLAGCIVALPFVGWMHRFDWALVLTALVLAECGVLAVNRGVSFDRYGCPMDNRADAILR